MASNEDIMSVLRSMQESFKTMQSDVANLKTRQDNMEHLGKSKPPESESTSEAGTPSGDLSGPTPTGLVHHNRSLMRLRERLRERRSQRQAADSSEGKSVDSKMDTRQEEGKTATPEKGVDPADEPSLEAEGSTTSSSAMISSSTLSSPRTPTAQVDLDTKDPPGVKSPEKKTAGKKPCFRCRSREHKPKDCPLRAESGTDTHSTPRDRHVRELKKQGAGKPGTGKTAIGAANDGPTKAKGALAQSSYGSKPVQANRVRESFGEHVRTESVNRGSAQQVRSPPRLVPRITMPGTASAGHGSNPWEQGSTPESRSGVAYAESRRLFQESPLGPIQTQATSQAFSPIPLSAMRAETASALTTTRDLKGDENTEYALRGTMGAAESGQPMSPLRARMRAEVKALTKSGFWINAEYAADQRERDSILRYWRSHSLLQEACVDWWCNWGEPCAPHVETWHDYCQRVIYAWQQQGQEAPFFGKWDLRQHQATLRVGLVTPHAGTIPSQTRSVRFAETATDTGVVSPLASGSGSTSKANPADRRASLEPLRGDPRTRYSPPPRPPESSSSSSGSEDTVEGQGVRQTLKYLPLHAEEKAFRKYSRSEERRYTVFSEWCMQHDEPTIARLDRGETLPEPLDHYVHSMPYELGPLSSREMTCGRCCDMHRCRVAKHIIQGRRTELKALQKIPLCRSCVPVGALSSKATLVWDSHTKEYMERVCKEPEKRSPRRTKERARSRARSQLKATVGYGSSSEDSEPAGRRRRKDRGSGGSSGGDSDSSDRSSRCSSYLSDSSGHRQESVGAESGHRGGSTGGRQISGSPLPAGLLPANPYLIEAETREAELLRKQGESYGKTLKNVSDAAKNLRRFDGAYGNVEGLATYGVDLRRFASSNLAVRQAQTLGIDFQDILQTIVEQSVAANSVLRKRMATDDVEWRRASLSSLERFLKFATITLVRRDTLDDRVAAWPSSVTQRAGESIHDVKERLLVEFEVCRMSADFAVTLEMLPERLLRCVDQACRLDCEWHFNAANTVFKAGALRKARAKPSEVYRVLNKVCEKVEDYQRTHPRRQSSGFSYFRGRSTQSSAVPLTVAGTPGNSPAPVGPLGPEGPRVRFREPPQESRRQTPGSPRYSGCFNCQSKEHLLKDCPHALKTPLRAILDQSYSSMTGPETVDWIHNNEEALEAIEEQGIADERLTETEAAFLNSIYARPCEEEPRA
jgi:hypothetical protein